MSAAATVAECLAAMTAGLAAAGVPTPRVDAELLAQQVLGWSGAQVALRGGQVLPQHAGAALSDLVARRAAREPLQLIVGSVGFRYLELEVRCGVFIPRPETEVLAGEAIALVPDDGVVVEPCTGSGAIACAIAAESQAGRVVATDADPDAVALARHNVARNHLAVTVAQGNLLAPVSQELRGEVDVLVSNPPYLAAGDLAAVEPEVAYWDPPAALVAGPTGHEVSDRLIAAATEWLKPGGWLLLEVAEARALDIVARCRRAGLVEAGALPDLTARLRIVRARRAAAKDGVRA